MAVGRERMVGGLAMQVVGDQVYIAKGPISIAGPGARGLIQDARGHLKLRVSDVEEFCEKLRQCAEES